MGEIISRVAGKASQAASDHLVRELTRRLRPSSLLGSALAVVLLGALGFEGARLVTSSPLVAEWWGRPSIFGRGRNRAPGPEPAPMPDPPATPQVFAAPTDTSVALTTSTYAGDGSDPQASTDWWIRGPIGLSATDTVWSSFADTDSLDSYALAGVSGGASVLTTDSTYRAFARHTGVGGGPSGVDSVEFAASELSFTPNLPSGMTLSYEFDFSTGNMSNPGGVGSGWQYDCSALNPPKSPPDCSRHVIPSGFKAGNIGLNINTLPANTVRIYLAYNIYLSDPYTLHPTANKGWYSRINGQGSAILDFVRANGLSGDVDTDSAKWIHGQPTAYENQPNPPRMVRGEWNHVEILYVMNTSGGTNDGILKVWVDGVPVMSYTSVLYSSGTLSWNRLDEDPYFGGTNQWAGTSQEQYLYYDHAVIYTSTSRN